MIRNFDEISDGRLYHLNDMVKADCNDCKDCFACCKGMGNSIILDPLDIHQLTSNLKLSFEELLIDKIELHVIEGVILPNLKMAGSEETCAFLNEEGRCTIHKFRPGICRLFPLGRVFEGDSFQYFLQVNECKNHNRTKVKVSKWIDTTDLKKNQKFIADWHYFIRRVKDDIKQLTDDGIIKEINLYLLHSFFQKKYDDQTDFYEQYAIRQSEAEEYIKKLRSQQE